MKMELEDTRTPRTLIRYITENKLVSTHPKTRALKRIRSPGKGEDLLKQSASGTSPTPRTLIRDVLKEKATADSSIYIPRRKSLLGKSIDKEPTPAFKRRAIVRKRSLRSSKVATPEKVQKESASKHLDISSPIIPYILSCFKRRQTTIAEFEHGVKEIRKRRKFASTTSDGNEQGKLEKIASSQEELSDEESEAKTEVWQSGSERGKELATTEEIHETGEQKLPDAQKSRRMSVHSTLASESVTGTETERWDSEGLGADRHKSSVDVRAWFERTEAHGSEDDRRNLFDTGESQDKSIVAETYEGTRTPSIPETEIFEPVAEREHLKLSEKEMSVPLSPGISELPQIEGKVPSLVLQKEGSVRIDSESDHSERIPPSEDEIPVTEDSFLQALETIEEYVEEVIPPVEAKSTDRSKRIRKKLHPPRFPSSLTKKLFQHYSGMRVSREALDAVESCCDAYFEQLTDDLLAYSNHAGRKSIEPQDVELLLRRQGFVTNERSLYALVEKYLPLEYRQEIIPMATANNVIIPKK